MLLSSKAQIAGGQGMSPSAEPETERSGRRRSLCSARIPPMIHR